MDWTGDSWTGRDWIRVHGTVRDSTGMIFTGVDWTGLDLSGLGWIWHECFIFEVSNLQRPIRKRISDCLHDQAKMSL